LIRNGSMSNDKISHIIEFVKKQGGLTFAEEKMNEFKAKAELALNEFPESESRQALLDLVSFTVERKK
jgi:octaprenyl-diphosphate synthase